MDIEKTIEFILNQQAQFTVDLQGLRETQVRQGELVGQLIGIMSQQTTDLKKLSQKTEQRFQEVAERIDKLADKVDGLADKVDGIADNMNALFKVVDDLVRRNGRRPKRGS